MKTKIDIISGFLGAGKTTLIKKLIEEKLYNEKVVIIENEFGEIGIDGELLKSSGLEIKEINSGCICCTLVGNFEKSITEIIDKFNPERIIVEPSGVGKLSEIIKACKKESLKSIVNINILMTVVDIEKFDLYSSNFGEFFEDQIKYGKTILLSRTQNASQKQIESVINSIRKINKKANIVTTPWEMLNSKQIVDLAENDLSNSLKYELFSSRKLKLASYNIKNSHISYNNHNASDTFQVWGIETPKIFNEYKIKDILEKLGDDNKFGTVVRGKGFLQIEENKWIQFDYIPQKLKIEETNADYTGRICIIGINLNREELNKAFLTID